MNSSISVARMPFVHDLNPNSFLSLSDSSRHIELRHLRYFIAVAEEENFRRAAIKLNVAQPALSRQVRQLEVRLGYRLFDRRSRGVCLNEVGRKFLADVRDLLADLDRVVERGRSLGRGQLGELKIGFDEAASSEPKLLDAFQAFRRSCGGAQLKLLPFRSTDQVGALQQGNIDISFAYDPDETSSENLSLELGAADIVLAVPRTHALAHGKHHVSLADLASQRFIFPDRENRSGWHVRVLQELFDKGLTLNIVQEVPTEGMTLSLLSTGEYMTFLPSSVAARCPPEVVLRPVSGLSMSCKLMLVWRKDNHSPVLRRFIDVFTRWTEKTVPASEKAVKRVRIAHGREKYDADDFLKIGQDGLAARSA